MKITERKVIEHQVGEAVINKEFKNGKFSNFWISSKSYTIEELRDLRLIITELEKHYDSNN